MDYATPLARNYAVCLELGRRACELLSYGDELSLRHYEAAADALGLIVVALAEESSVGHSFSGVFFSTPDYVAWWRAGGPAGTNLSRWEEGVLLAVLHEDNSGSVYTVASYPTAGFSTARSGPLVEPLPIPGISLRASSPD